MNTLFQRLVLSRLWLTFVVLGLSFLAFGAGAVNLGLSFMASARLLSENGWAQSRTEACNSCSNCR